MNANVEVRQVDVRASDVRSNDAKQITPQFQEDEEAVVVQEQKAGLNRVKTISIIAILLAITQIVLASIHLANHELDLAKALLASGIVNLLVAGLTIWWSNKTRDSYSRTTAELLQPRPNDRLTRSLFIVGLVLAATSSALLVNCVVQKEYSTDYVAAQRTTDHIWNEKYGEERTEEGLTKMLRVFLIVQAVLSGIFIFHFLYLARTAFRCLKWDNQAMSYLVFLGNVLLLGFGLAVIYLAQNAYGYGDYPQVRAHFPVWNIKALFFLGLFAAATALIGFLVDHRSWRVGFFVLTFLLATLLVLLGNFTGLAYRHANSTYNYYKGTNDVATCLNRMPLVSTYELEDIGCPAKYLEPANCDANERVTRWEPFPPAEPTPEPTGTAATPALTFTFEELQADSVIDDTLSFSNERILASDASTGYYCLNELCCGLQGQVYEHDLLRLANFGLFTILSGLLLTIACTYFWYVKWIDTARDKRRDFFWLAVMIILFVAFVALLIFRDEPLVEEQVSTAGKHI